MGGRQTTCRVGNCSVSAITQNPNDFFPLQNTVVYTGRTKVVPEKMGLEALWDPSQTGRELQIYK